MARRQAFVFRHPMVAVAIILIVELLLIATLHYAFDLSPLSIVLGGIVVLVVVSMLLG